MRRTLFFGLLIALVFAVSAGLAAAGKRVEKLQRVVAPHAPYPIRDEVRAFHDTLRIVDLHADSFLWGRDVLEPSELGHVDLPRMLLGNMALQLFGTVTKSPKNQNVDRNSADTDQLTTLVVYNRWPTRTWTNLFERAAYQGLLFDDAASRSGGKMQPVRNKSDLQRLFAARARGEQVCGGILGTEGMHALEGNLGNLQALFDKGFRTAGLQHFFDNEVGGSLHGIEKGGLTPFGIEVIHKLNALGMIIDVAHSSEDVVRDVLKLSSRPVIVSHTGVKGACDTARNIPDALMKEIALTGGLIGIGFWDKAVCDTTPAGVVKSIRYAIQLLGVDHVALGSDYDGAVNTTFDVSELAVLTQTMIEQGFSEVEVRKVMGENAIRFLSEQLPDP